MSSTITSASTNVADKIASSTAAAAKSVKAPSKVTVQATTAKTSGNSSSAPSPDSVSVGEGSRLDPNVARMTKLARERANHGSKAVLEVKPQAAAAQKPAAAEVVKSEVAEKAAAAPETAEKKTSSVPDAEMNVAKTTEASDATAPKTGTSAHPTTTEASGIVDRSRAKFQAYVSTGNGKTAMKIGDGGVKGYSSYSNLTNGFDHIVNAKDTDQFARGVYETSSGSVEGTQLLSGLFEDLGGKITTGVASKLAKVGCAAGFIGTAVNAMDFVQALKDGNTVAACEKGADTVASVPCAIAGIPAVSTSIQATLATSGAVELGTAGAVTGSALGAFAALAAGTGWVAGRGISSATGLDGMVTDFFEHSLYGGKRGFNQSMADAAERTWFGEGQQNLAKVDDLNGRMAALSERHGNDGLRLLADAQPELFARSITGTLDRIHTAREQGLPQELKRAEAELKRLRAVQHGQG